MTLCAGYLQTAARQFDDGKPFRIRPAIASDIDALLQLEAESWWQESRWSRERILASIRRGSRISSAEETSGRLDVTHALSSPPTGSNQTTEGSITSEREAPGDDVFVLEVLKPNQDSERSLAQLPPPPMLPFSVPTAATMRTTLLGAIYTQFIESEDSLDSVRDVHSCHLIRSPWSGKVLQLIRVNTCVESFHTNSQSGSRNFGLIAAGAILRDFVLAYAAALGDVRSVCAVTRCTDYSPQLRNFHLSGPPGVAT
jgi:hypothetical protein